MCFQSFPSFLKVFGQAVRSPGPLRPVHAPAAGSQRESLRKSMLFCSVLLRDLQDPAGSHGLSPACPRALPFAAYRKMLKFPTILKVFGQAVTDDGPLRPVHAPTAGSQRGS